jgi:hypothetical protein
MSSKFRWETSILKDDFAYLIDTKSRRNFTSNRDGGQGYDIYKFLKPKTFLWIKNYMGEIITQFSFQNKILPNTKVTLYDNRNST